MSEQTYIDKLTLTNFRNYAALSIELRPGPVILTGDNGAGKTNLLEAVSLLTPGRGLRRAPYADVAREGGDGGFALHARLDGPAGQVEIGTGVPGGDSTGEAGRRVRINGAPARSADDMLEWLRVMWLTPSMDALFTGPAGDRRRFVDRIHQLGGRIALDDFGAGFSSFSYLKDLAVDAIKIDGAFVKSMAAHPANLAIVEAIVALAKNLGIRSVAEWVEDAATLEALSELGVDYVQGFLIARPQTPEAILAADSAASFVRDPELATLLVELGQAFYPRPGSSATLH